MLGELDEGKVVVAMQLYIQISAGSDVESSVYDSITLLLGFMQVHLASSRWSMLNIEVPRMRWCDRHPRVCKLLLPLPPSSRVLQLARSGRWLR